MLIFLSKNGPLFSLRTLTFLVIVPEKKPISCWQCFKAQSRLSGNTASQNKKRPVEAQRHSIPECCLRYTTGRLYIIQSQVYDFLGPKAWFCPMLPTYRKTSHSQNRRPDPHAAIEEPALCLSDRDCSFSLTYLPEVERS